MTGDRLVSNTVRNTVLLWLFTKRFDPCDEIQSKQLSKLIKSGINVDLWKLTTDFPFLPFSSSNVTEDLVKIQLLVLFLGRCVGMAGSDRSTFPPICCSYADAHRILCVHEKEGKLWLKQEAGED